MHVVEAVWDLEDVLHGDLRNRDELGVRALEVEAHQRAVLAEMLVAVPAELAVAAIERRDDVDEIAGLQVDRLGVGPEPEHLAADLVAEDGAGLDPAVAIVERPNVGAADAARGYAQKGAVRRAGRGWHRAQMHLAWPVPDGPAPPPPPPTP